MENIQSLFLKKSATILDSLQVLDKVAQQIVIVVDENNCLEGTVTDGDIRRAILKGTELTASISTVMNKNPIIVYSSDASGKSLMLLRKYGLKHIPVLNEQRQVINLVKLSDFAGDMSKENLVVLMAGGLGTRLRPLTEEVPKPLLKVGDKAILETILDSFIAQGFYRFALTVNYKSEMITQHFGDGSRWGVEIEYIREEKRLGTAGALSLLSRREEKPIIVMNGDLLTKVNFNHLLDFHQEHGAHATMCVRSFEYQVPYGVISANGVKLQAVLEKPTYSYFVNAGIYVLNASVLKYIPRNSFYDMPTLFEDLIVEKKSTVVFPIREYWLDIGQMKDFEKAQMDFREVFSDY